ncbi:MAG TPA: DNA gyrase C-terminal beta-propeller domain-containing protein, partial [bacterium]
RAIVNILQIEKDERVAAFVNVKEFNEKLYVVMASRRGVIKKTELSAFSNPRRGGINAMGVKEGDDLIDAKITDGSHDILLGTHDGMSIRFHESEVRDMGRTASGVRGISLGEDDYVIDMVVIKREGTILAVTEKGYGKRTHIKEYRVSHRGGKGIFTVKVTDKTGHMVALKEVIDEDDIMIITSNGVVIRQSVVKLRTLGRNTQGFRLIKLDEDDTVADVARVVKEEEDEEGE